MHRRNRSFRCIALCFNEFKLHGAAIHSYSTSRGRKRRGILCSDVWSGWEKTQVSMYQRLVKVRLIRSCFNCAPRSCSPYLFSSITFNCLLRRLDVLSVKVSLRSPLRSLFVFLHFKISSSKRTNRVSMLVKNIKKRKKESREILSPIFFETYESEREREKERESLVFPESRHSV